MEISASDIKTTSAPRQLMLNVQVFVSYWNILALFNDRLTIYKLVKSEEVF